MRAIEGGCLLWQRRRIQIASYPVRPIFLLGHQHPQNKHVHWLETTTTISADVDGYGSGDDHVDVVVDGECDDHVDVDVGNAIKWIVVLSSVSGCKLWSLHSVSRPLRDPDLIWIKNRTLSSPTPGGGPEWAGTSHLEMDKVVQSPQTNKLPCYHHSSPAICFFLVMIWTRYCHLSYQKKVDSSFQGICLETTFDWENRPYHHRKPSKGLNMVFWHQ